MSMTKSMFHFTLSLVQQVSYAARESKTRRLGLCHLGKLGRANRTGRLDKCMCIGMAKQIDRKLTS
jgi:hypothetical protein